MKLRLRLLLPAAVLLLGLGTIAAACNGDDEPTLFEFFQQGQAIGDDYQGRFARLFDDLPVGEEFFLNEENLPAYQETLVAFNDLNAAFIDELGALNSPSEVEDLWDELLAAGSERQRLEAEAADRIRVAESFAEIDRLEAEALADPEFQAFNERYEAACQSLQEIADANGIITSLICAFGE